MVKRTHPRAEVRDEAKYYLLTLLSKNAYVPTRLSLSIIPGYF